MVSQQTPLPQLAGEALARQKLTEVDVQMRRAQAMKRLLEEELLRCRCLKLAKCARYIGEQGTRETIVPETPQLK